MSIPYSPKLRLAPLIPAGAALVLVAGLAIALLPGTLAHGEAESLQAALRIVAPSVPLPGPGGDRPDAAIQERITALADETPYRITVIELDGDVVADSDRTLQQVGVMDNHRARPEVAAALETGEGRSVRTSKTTGLETAYAARVVRGDDGRTAIVRLGLPLRSLGALRRRLWGVLLLSAAVAAVLTLALSWWLTRSLFEPLSELIATAHRLGEGNYSARPEIPDESELATLGRALERIATRAERQIAAVEAERDHLRSTMASMSEGVLVTDRQGRVKIVNPAFRDLFGLPADADAATVLELVRQPRLTDLIAASLQSGNGGATELELLEPEPRSLTLLSSPLAAGEGLVVVARDVTEAERLSRTRKDFVANVSHELKTPLAAIRGYAETLVDGAVDERDTALRFSTRILDQCRRLGDLLDDLLTLSRLEGTEPFRAVERVDLREIAAEAVEMVAAAAATRSVTVRVTGRPPAGGRGRRGRARAAARQPARQRHQVQPAGRRRARSRLGGAGGPGRARGRGHRHRHPGRGTCRASSSASTGSTRGARARRAAPASGSRSSSTSPRPTRGGSRSRASPAPAPPSASCCP